MTNKTFSKEINEFWDWVGQTNLKITYTLIDLRCMAKAQNIKGYYKMNKVTLYEKLIDGMDKYDRIKFSLQIDNNTLRKSCENENKYVRNMPQTNLEDSPKNENKTKRYFCVHGKYKYSCRSCQGSVICSHGRQKYYCRACFGSGICPPQKTSLSLSRLLRSRHTRTR